VLKPALPFLDYILPSLEEAKQITGQTKPREIAEVFFEHGIGTVGLKMGDAGAYVRTAQGDEIIVPALSVPVVDTLGAGDAWSGGFLRGILRGWDLAQTTRFANAVGALCVQSLGATHGLRSFGETCALAGVL
jgi:sugar/nucleoside kinase (ribokinase family)